MIGRMLPRVGVARGRGSRMGGVRVFFESLLAEPDLVVKRVVLTEATHGSSYRDLVTTMSGTLGALSQELASALPRAAPGSPAGTSLP